MKEQEKKAKKGFDFSCCKGQDMSKMMAKCKEMMSKGGDCCTKFKEMLKGFCCK